MTSFADILSQGVANAWLFIPSAILLGALHGLEPGHSKTMMAAFIVAIRGTVRQAVMLGLAATISHTGVVWGIALGGLYLWRDLQAEEAEPYFQLASGAIIVMVALWMIGRTWVDNQKAGRAAHHNHEGSLASVDTGHGHLTICLQDNGQRQLWQLNSDTLNLSRLQVALRTTDEHGNSHEFSFNGSKSSVLSHQAVPHFHDLKARLTLGHDGHQHHYDLNLHHHHHHHHGHSLDLGDDEYQDSHQLAHAEEIRRRFQGGKVTNWQIILFGLTGGLIPCPAAITVLLLCLQVKELALGATLVLSFSVGLAVTLVVVGAVAALGLRQATRRFSGLGSFLRRAPYFSGGLILLVGCYMGMHGWLQLAARAAG